MHQRRDRCEGTTYGTLQPLLSRAVWGQDGVAVEARHPDRLVDLAEDDETRPILLAMSANGPQMTRRPGSSWPCAASPSTFGRPETH
jgi:hypothetical protein